MSTWIFNINVKTLDLFHVYIGSFILSEIKVFLGINTRYVFLNCLFIANH